MNEQSMQWDDLRIVLAIHESGSLSAAGRRLRLSHATVFRRLKALEQRLGVALFERGRSGYVATPAGSDLAGTASRVQAEVQAVERRVIGRDVGLFGTLRVTTTDTLMEGLLAPLFAGFAVDHPGIELEIALSNQLFNLSERDADIAIRPTVTPPEHWVGRPIGRIEQALYRPALTEQGKALDWIGPDRHMGYRTLEKWLEGEGVHPRFRVDSLLAMKRLVAAGMGQTVLPCYLAGADTALVQVGDTIDSLSSDLWVLTHPDLRRVGRVRALMHYLAEAMAAD